MSDLPLHGRVSASELFGGQAIVVGIDDTDDSEYAFEYAVENLYVNGKHQLHLIHAITTHQ